VPGRRIAVTVASILIYAFGCGLMTACASGPRTTYVPTAATTPAFANLPPTALMPVPPFSYAESADAQHALDLGRVGSVLSAFSGGVSRDLVAGGKVVGGVLLYRFAADVAATERVHFPPMIVYTFAGSTPHQSKVGGQVVQRVDRGSDGRTVIGWTHDDYVVVVWTYDRAVATRFVGDYILRSM
jgi:hypothetical protein